MEQISFLFFSTKIMLYINLVMHGSGNEQRKIQFFFYHTLNFGLIRFKRIPNFLLTQANYNNPLLPLLVSMHQN